jgi:hypothetical protein
MKRIVRNYEPLPTRKVKVIAAILADAWEVPPAKKAALALLEAGFTAHDIWRFGKSKTARLMDDMWHNNTYNEMHNIEIENMRLRT